MAPSFTSNSPNLHTLLPATTESVDETHTLGVRLVEVLDAGAVLGLHGDLGTGKTHLVKGIADGLGIPPTTVRSPTFTILHTYNEGRRPLHHFDAYRVQTPDEFVELGFEEYVHGAGITCIEWADRVESLLPPNTIHLTLTHLDANRRHIARRTADATPEK
jgi:tRNA threonylcarbamoyladenosine biosynthesis protein TsaE